MVPFPWHDGDDDDDDDDDDGDDDDGAASLSPLHNVRTLQCYNTIRFSTRAL
jgi:hypothetical protein